MLRCVCVFTEMVDFGESDKMIKISGKVDKLNTFNGFNGNSSVNKKYKTLPLNPLCFIYPLFHIFLSYIYFPDDAC